MPFEFGTLDPEFDRFTVLETSKLTSAYAKEAYIPH